MAPGAWPWDRVSAEGRAVIAERIKHPPAKLYGALASPDVVRTLALDAPEHCLVLLEILAEVGGRATVAFLASEAKRRVGLPGALVEIALNSLDARGLCVRLTARGRGSWHSDVAALCEPSAEIIARMVRGISLPAEQPPADATRVASIGRAGQRDALAVIALAAHRKLRFTVSGSVNRSGLRGFVKGLGIEAGIAEQDLEMAIDLGLLGARNDRLVPRADRLLAVAREGLDDRSTRGCVEQWLPDTGWASVEALARALLVAHARPDPDAVFFGSDGPEPSRPLTDLRGAISALPGLDCVESDDQCWVRRAALGAAGGDGHVTPSFDVLLGPAADLELVATVALGAELVKVDHMLTLRLSPASVTAGLACGLGAASLMDALERVAPRALPDNVRAMIKDWIDHARLASVENVRLVQLPAEVADLLCSGPLAADVAARVSPTQLAVSTRVSVKRLEQELERLGASLCRTTPLHEAVHQRRYFRGDALDDFDLPAELDAVTAFEAPAAAEAAAVALPLPLCFEGDAVLRAGFAAARASGFASSTARLEEVAALLANRASPTVRALGELIDAAALGDEATARTLSLLRDLWIDAEPMLAEWAASRAVSADAAELDPLRLLSWLVLEQKSQRAALDRARAVDGLLREAERRSQFLSAKGRALVDAVRWEDGERALQLLESVTAPPMERAAIDALFHRVPPGTLLELVLRGAAGAPEPIEALVQGVQQRGDGLALLVVDVATDQGRVVHAQDVLAARPLE